MYCSSQLFMCADQPSNHAEFLPHRLQCGPGYNAAPPCARTLPPRPPLLLYFYNPKWGEVSCAFLRPVFLRTFVAGRRPALSCEMSCAFLRPIFLRTFVAGRCPAKGPAASCAPSLSAHALQDAVLQLPAPLFLAPCAAGCRPAASCAPFYRHMRCRTLS